MQAVSDSLDTNYVETVPPPTKTSKPLLTDLIQQSIFHKRDDINNDSLHVRVTKLPFYKKLYDTTITGEELILHCVNISDLFAKLETLLETHQCYGDIIGKDLYRHSQQEKDINFLCGSLYVNRPAPSNNAKALLKFIEDHTTENIAYLLPILFVEYGGLFVGRKVYNATITCFRKMIPQWEEYAPDNRGVCFWDFKMIHSPEEGEVIKKAFYSKINKVGADFEEKHPGISKKLVEIAAETFQLHTNMVASCADFPQKPVKEIKFFEKENPQASRI